MNAKEISKLLQKMGDKEDSLFLQGFFKTGGGQYGEGDIFLGIRVPALRKLAKEHKALPFKEVLLLLRSPYHEVRLFALILFVNAFAQGDETIQKKIYDLYMTNTRYINNWDLVDISAPNIVGTFLMEKSKKPLYQLAKSEPLGAAYGDARYFLLHQKQSICGRIKDRRNFTARQRRFNSQGYRLDVTRSRQT